MSNVGIKETTNLDAVYKTALKLLSDAYDSQKIFFNVLKTDISLSWFEPLCIPAMRPVERKKIITNYLHSGKIYNIAITGILAWAVINILEDYSEGEKEFFLDYFTNAEEYFDSKANVDGLMPTGAEGNWLKSANRHGILIENQAYYGKILDILFLLTNDDVYDFKKKRLIGAVRDKLDGAYVLDAEDTLEVRPNNFLAAFFAPELFKHEDWKTTFNTSLRDNELWFSWGGLSTLGKSDSSYNSERDGESWFFINNIAGIVLSRLSGFQYDEKIQSILSASAKNVLWQEHSGRPCEVTLTSGGQIKVQGLYGISLATFIYLYRITQSI